ncbi:MAG TPA: hypothetical protein ENJ78_01265 [candidate division WWE3 bacterium]|uniref:Uncharacterized protein n=1 Tax=candidate division WWE3 bacterium TaxID=2053526 RepID=A0A7V5J0C4_UNCKA|nr:hypothetical protein [candidate division WWE3 bacterium]
MPFESNNTIKAIAVVFLFIFIFGIYIFSTRVSTKPAKPLENTAQEQKSSAYFSPPESPYKEVELTGKVEKSVSQKPKATHVLYNKDGSIIAYLYTDDDKLKQQEGNRVTIVGRIPYSTEVSPDTIVFVKYILFK